MSENSGNFFLRRNFGVWEKFRDLEGTILVCEGKSWFLRQNPDFLGEKVRVLRERF